MMIAGTEHRRQGCSLQDGKQWGENVGGGGQTVSLPISFEVAFTAVVSADSSWCNASCHITTTTITTMNYQSNKPDIAQLGPVQWLAIGIQPQWGYYVESQNPTDYRYWSIPFTSHYITMATKTYYEPKEEAVPWLVGIDMQKFICGYGANFIGSSYVSCVGIGCQPQWRNNPGLWAIPFTEFVAGGITMTRTGSQSSGTWYGDSGTISLTGYTASCATNESWVSNISGSAIAVGL